MNEYFDELATLDPTRVRAVGFRFDKAGSKFIENGREISALELPDNVKRWGTRPLIDATTLNYPELQLIFHTLSDLSQPFDVIYVEPDDYRERDDIDAISGQQKFDLSDDGPGLEQLWPFVGTTQSNCTNIISMGFEGHRVVSLLSSDQLSEPGLESVRLIVGVPAYRAGFDLDSLRQNSEALRLVECADDRELTFVAANNAFEMYQQLNKIAKAKDERWSFNLVPFGTKPSAIAMAWFATKNHRSSIVTYDFVSKKKGRSTGVGRTHFIEFG